MFEAYGILKTGLRTFWQNQDNPSSPEDFYDMAEMQQGSSHSRP